MKRILVLLLFFIFITGCGNYNDTSMIIEKHKNSTISIQYPITHIKNIDNPIKKYIDNIYDSFYNNYVSNELESEVNVDYLYDFYSERYYVITLFTYIYDCSNDKDKSDVFSIVYDNFENKILSLIDVISFDDLSSFVEKVRNKILIDYENELNIQKLDAYLDDFLEKDVYFSIHPNDLTIYFPANSISDFSDKFFAISFSPSDIAFKVQVVTNTIR